MAKTFGPRQKINYIITTYDAQKQPIDVVNPATDLVLDSVTVLRDDNEIAIDVSVEDGEIQGMSISVSEDSNRKTGQYLSLIHI